MPALTITLPLNHPLKRMGSKKEVIGARLDQSSDHLISKKGRICVPFAFVCRPSKRLSRLPTLQGDRGQAAIKAWVEWFQ